MDRTLVCRIPSAAAMEALGAAIATCCRGGEAIYLEGALGAGKTTLVRGLLRALGHEGRVKSPTYTLVESYHPAGMWVHHFDLYRLSSPGELVYLGVEECFDGHAICLVEWPERGGTHLPRGDLALSLQYEAPTGTSAGRRVRFQSLSPVGQGLIRCLASHGYGI